MLRLPRRARRSRLTALLVAALAWPGCPASNTTPPEGDAGEADARSMLDAGRPDVGASCDDPDSDGDGHDSTACGGTDCDDGDRMRAPGRPEICDLDDLDEDCDPTTFGFRDRDTDGEGDAACCNVDGAGTRVCGGDCDDARASVWPGAGEICDAIDQDCDGGIDEGVSVLLYGDGDGDGYGADDTRMGCAGAAGTTTLPGDCDDAVPGRNPGAPEVCNGIDDDCDASVDDIIDGVVACTSGASRACTTGVGLAGTQTCAADCLGFAPCRAPEACNGVDDDGDGDADEDFSCELGVLGPCDTACGTRGSATCLAGCVAGACSAPEVCNFCDDDGTDGIAGESGLATSSDAARILFADSGATPPITTRLAGGATRETVGLTTGETGYEDVVRLLDGSAGDDTGAYWIEIDRYQGWGPTTILGEARVRSTDGGYPMGGWSIVLATGGTGDLGTARDHGVPLTRTGVRFDWIWGYPYLCCVNEGDRLAYGALGRTPMWRGTLFAGPNPAEVGRAVPSGGFDTGQTTFVTQQFVAVYQPEDPYTVAREERVTIAFPSASARACTTDVDCTTLGTYCVAPLGGARQCLNGSVYAPDLDTNTADPNSDLAIGSRLSIGITAGSYSHTFRPPGAPMSVTVGARVVAEVVLRATIYPPPGAPIAERTVPRTAISRGRTCPGF